MSKYSLRIFGFSTLLAFGLLFSFSNAVSPAQAADGTAQVTQSSNVSLSEEERRERLEILIEQLVAILKRLYPQIDWDALIGNDDEEENDDDNDDDDNGDEDDEDEDEDDEGVEPDVGSPEATAPVGNNEARATYEIPISLSAFGDSFYIEKSATRDATVSSNDGITYVIEDSAGTTYTGGSATASFTSSSRSGDTGTYFKIDDDEDREFTLKITFDNEGGTGGFYRARIVGIAFDEDTSPGGEDTITSIFDSSETPVVFVDDENTPS